MGQRSRAVAGWLNPCELFACCFVIGGVSVSFSGSCKMYARAAYRMLPVSSCRAESAAELSYVCIQVDEFERQFKAHIVTHFCDELA